MGCCIGGGLPSTGPRSATGPGGAATIAGGPRATMRSEKPSAFIARQECHRPRGADHAAVVIGIGHRNPVGHGGGDAVKGRAVHAIDEIERQRILGGVGMHRLERHVVKADFQHIGVMGGDLETGRAALRRSRGGGQQHAADPQGKCCENGLFPDHDGLPLARAKQQP